MYSSLPLTMQFPFTVFLSIPSHRPSSSAILPPPALPLPLPCRISAHSSNSSAFFFLLLLLTVALPLLILLVVVR